MMKGSRQKKIGRDLGFFHQKRPSNWKINSDIGGGGEVTPKPFLAKPLIWSGNLNALTLEYKLKIMLLTTKAFHLNSCVWTGISIH